MFRIQLKWRNIWIIKNIWFQRDFGQHWERVAEYERVGLDILSQDTLPPSLYFLSNREKVSASSTRTESDVC